MEFPIQSILLMLLLLKCGIVLPSMHSIDISFTVNAYDAGPCYGGTSAGLGSTNLTLEYRNNASGFQWVEIAGNIPIGDNFSTAANIPGSGCVVVRLVQEEHGGGNCNCWNLTNLVPNSIDITSQCGGSASVPRSVEWSYSESSDTCDDVPPIPVPRTKPFKTTCSQSLPYINVTFQLNFPSTDPIDDLDEGVELSLQLGSESGWIPIAFIVRRDQLDRNDYILVGDGDSGNVLIRDYQTELKNATNEINIETICGFENSVDSVQFRWLQTCRFGTDNPVRDAWTLEDVLITFQDGEDVSFVLFNSSNATSWSPSNIRNGVSTGEGILNFGNHSIQDNNTTKLAIVSRSVTTNPLSLSFNYSMDESMTPMTTRALPIGDTTTTTTRALPIGDTTTTTTRALPIGDTTTTTTRALPIGDTTTTTTRNLPIGDTTTIDDTTTTTAMGKAGALRAVQQANMSVQDVIMNDQRLRNITALPPAQALDELAAVISDVERDDDEVVLIYLLGSILNQATNESSLLINDFIGVVTSIIDNYKNEADSYNVVGTSLLAIMDDYAFNHFEEEGSFVLENIALQTRQLTTDSDDPVTAIDSSDFPSFSQTRMSIEIPPDLVRIFRNMSGMGSNGVRLVSFLYASVSDLFSSGIPGENSTSELASGIVSTALQCGTGKCSTEYLQLDTPVRITIEHTDVVKGQLERSNSSFTLEVQCVFMDLLTDGILSAGQWSERGCSRSESLSNTSVTVCECDHLTHFAILLSAAPLNLTDAVVLSLEVIGYVGVSVSLVAMGLVIFTFVAFKKLHNMRNYIHINLCINLGISQLIFVAGIDQSASDYVPIHCQVIAVLLNYFFLVSFMWMLMEGVVLYVALVRVFVKHKRRYLFAFTITSYGIPLLYLGLLTLPLGFALPTQPNYGYNTACFLNTETNFIWAFIAPVIVIIVINVGFFIMAASIMWRQQKKQSSNSDLYTFKNWLKAAVSLVVIMGLTWILGVLIVEVDELVPLAYIYTIMVAFQGLFIFFIFIVLSNKVREAYAKFWRVKVNESYFLSKYYREKNLSASKQPSRSPASKEVSSDRGVKKQGTDMELI